MVERLEWAGTGSNRRRLVRRRKSGLPDLRTKLSISGKPEIDGCASQPSPGGFGSAQTSVRSLRKRNCYAGPTMRICLQWLDAARRKGGESRPDRGASRPRPEARSQKHKSPRWSAGRRGILTQISLRNLRRLDCVGMSTPPTHSGLRACAGLAAGVTCWCVARRSAPSGHFPGANSPGPLGWKENDRRARSLTKNAGDGALAV